MATSTEEEVRDTVTRIKICGITNQEDAQAAVQSGADALGFILVPDTPRYVGNSDALNTLLGSVPPFVSRVAVCQEATDLELRYRGAFHATQFYYPVADQSWHWYSSTSLIYAARIQDESSLTRIAEALPQMSTVAGDVLISALLLDTYHKAKLGGSGETFNWELAVEAKCRFGLPLILAGGLTPENVGEAVRTVRPYAVDVSSGVEASPGRKDHAKVKAFIQAVREADREP
jgi:phosphoribosylanthranilate isomerase